MRSHLMTVFFWARPISFAGASRRICGKIRDTELPILAQLWTKYLLTDLHTRFNPICL